MRDWLSIELVLATLIVTTYTSVGLVALWAATSARHWFFRAALVVGVLSVPLLIPAYEPLVVFAIEILIVWIGATIWRRRLAQPQFNDGTPSIPTEPKCSRTLRFSLVTLLLLTPLVAVVAAIVAKTVRDFPELNVESVTTLVLNGVAAGCTVLLGAWIFVARRKWLAMPAAFAICLGLAAVNSEFEWFFSSLTWSSWPAEPGVNAFMDDSHPELAWFAVLPAITLATWLMLRIASAAFNPRTLPGETHATQFDHTARRSVALCFFGVLLALFALPAAVVTWQVLHPLPLPTPPPLQVNGFKDVAAAGRAFDTSPILNTAVEPKSAAELAAEIAKYAAAYDLLQTGMSREIRVRNWAPGTDLLADFATMSISDVRGAARAMSRKAELAQQEGRYGDAAEVSFENIRLGHAITRDGLLIDLLVGIAVEGTGHRTLYEAVPLLNANECRGVIAALNDFEERREPFDAVMARDRAWSDHASGWSGCFLRLLNDVAPSYDTTWGSEQAVRRMQAVTRLLIIQAASRGYQLEHGAPPEQLEQLTPKFLSAVPVDPFDLNGSPLRYVHSKDSYIAYSVGENARDDGGRPPTRNESGYFDTDGGDGDLRLDIYMTKYSDATGPSAALPDEPAGDEPDAK